MKSLSLLCSVGLVFTAIFSTQLLATEAAPRKISVETVQSSALRDLSSSFAGLIEKCGGLKADYSSKVVAYWSKVKGGGLFSGGGDGLPDLYFVNQVQIEGDAIFNTENGFYEKSDALDFSASSPSAAMQTKAMFEEGVAAVVADAALAPNSSECIAAKNAVVAMTMKYFGDKMGRFSPITFGATKAFRVVFDYNYVSAYDSRTHEFVQLITGTEDL